MPNVFPRKSAVTLIVEFEPDTTTTTHLIGVWTNVAVILAPAPLAIEEMGPSVKPISNINLFVFEHPCQLPCSSTTSKFSYLDSHAVLWKQVQLICKM
jgi:hypothetical protein